MKYIIALGVLGFLVTNAGAQLSWAQQKYPSENPPSVTTDSSGTFNFRYGSLSASMRCPTSGEESGSSFVSTGLPMGCIGMTRPNSFLIVYNDGLSESGEIPSNGQGFGVSGCYYGNPSVVNSPDHGGVAVVLGCSYQAREFGKTFDGRPKLSRSDHRGSNFKQISETPARGNRGSSFHAKYFICFKC